MQQQIKDVKDKFVLNYLVSLLPSQYNTVQELIKEDLKKKDDKKF
jgi:hypothetical protein